jgi:chlorite dismutase
MTNLEALQSTVEYTNANLLTKALLDQGVTSTATYTAADQRGVDLAAADIYLYLCSHPNFKEGSKYIDYSKGALMSLRRELLRKHGMLADSMSAPGVVRNSQTHTLRQRW